MTVTRRPAVAGLFYPDDPAELHRTVRGHLDAAAPQGPAPKALIVPHAGYVYSGEVAAAGYARVDRSVSRVVLLGPAHRYPVRALAAHSAERFATPLGEIPVDPAVRELPHTEVLDAAHLGEHSLEVHLPFLQVVLDDFSLLPLVVGDARAEQVAEVLELVWGGPETLIVVSSDLSHFHDYETARRIDGGTARAIEGLRPERIGPAEACGCRPIGGLLLVAKRKGLTVESIDLRNSGDTAGSRREVVGYGTFVAR